jgi:hypothetical protein
VGATGSDDEGRWCSPSNSFCTGRGIQRQCGIHLAGGYRRLSDISCATIVVGWSKNPREHVVGRWVCGLLVLVLGLLWMWRSVTWLADRLVQSHNTINIQRAQSEYHRCPLTSTGFLVFTIAVERGSTPACPMKML